MPMRKVSVRFILAITILLFTKVQDQQPLQSKSQTFSSAKHENLVFVERFMAMVVA